jgi:hypothetical protein
MTHNVLILVLYYVDFDDLFHYIIALVTSRIEVIDYHITNIKHKFLKRYVNEYGYFHSYPNGYVDGDYKCEFLSTIYEGKYINNVRYDQHGEKLIDASHIPMSEPFGYRYDLSTKRYRRIVCGVVHGYIVEKREEGLSAGRTVNGKREGLHRIHHNGHISIRNYVSDVNVGRDDEYANGQLIRRCIRDNEGCKNGAEDYYKNGRLLRTIVYVHGTQLEQ